MRDTHTHTLTHTHSHTQASKQASSQWVRESVRMREGKFKYFFFSLSVSVCLSLSVSVFPLLFFSLLCQCIYPMVRQFVELTANWLDWLLIAPFIGWLTDRDLQYDVSAQPQLERQRKRERKWENEKMLSTFLLLPSSSLSFLSYTLCCWFFYFTIVYKLELLCLWLYFLLSSL
jgi:hypothetical protein